MVITAGVTDFVLFSSSQELKREWQPTFLHPPPPRLGITVTSWTCVSMCYVTQYYFVPTYTHSYSVLFPTLMHNKNSHMAVSYGFKFSHILYSWRPLKTLVVQVCYLTIWPSLCYCWFIIYISIHTNTRLSQCISQIWGEAWRSRVTQKCWKKSHDMTELNKEWIKIKKIHLLSHISINFRFDICADISKSTYVQEHFGTAAIACHPLTWVTHNPGSDGAYVLIDIVQV